MSTTVEVIFWDVKHGHATYIKSPNSKHIVIDLGVGDYSGNNPDFSPLQHLKQHHNVDQLDYVIITHPHLDHIDDIHNFDLLQPKILLRPSSISEKQLLAGVREQDKAKYNKYIEICSRYNSPVKENDSDPDDSNNYGGLKISRFIPSHYEGDNLNNYSIVTVIEYAEIKIVLPGDNEKSCLDELMKQSDFKTAIVDADILLAPHHGRESAYNNDFVTHVNPRLTIVSDGKYCDISANSRYSQKSRGWNVYKKDGISINRKCLATNSDGEVYVKFGYKSEKDKSRFLNVNIK